MVVTIESEKKAKELKREIFKKKNSSAKRLLQEIISLGGDKTDLDLLRDVLSGSEKEEEEEEEIKVVEKKASLKIDEKALEKDLAVFVKALDIKAPIMNGSDESSEEEEILQENEKNKPLTKKEKKKLRKERLKEAQEVEKQQVQTSAGVDLSKISSEFLQDINLNDAEPIISEDLDDIGKIRFGKEREGDVRNMVDNILQGMEPKENLEWGNQLLFESDSNLWYENSLEVLQASPNQDVSLVSPIFAKAEALWKADAASYEKRMKS